MKDKNVIDILLLETNREERGMLTPLADPITKSVDRGLAYLRKMECADRMLQVINGYAIKLPIIVNRAFVRIQRAARSVRPAVRQTFAARKAAKSSDSGGDPDGRPRPQQSHTLKNPRSTQFSTAFSFGGAL